MESTDQQRSEGKRAFAKGLQLMDNPYAKFSIPWYVWRDGWFWEQAKRGYRCMKKR